MGLLIKLQNGDTALKSLKFGKDRLGGGDSGQPYIQNPIIDEPGKLSQADNDFLLRGGLRAPINAAEDVARLTKYMFSLKNPSGLLFIAKQNLLSRVAVATEASISPGYANSPTKPLAWTKAPLNQGIYTPLSTLAQAGVGWAGIHLNTFGINPFQPIAGVPQPPGFFTNLSIVRYEDVVRGETNLTKRVKVEKWVPDPTTPPPVPRYAGTNVGPQKPKLIKVTENQRVPVGRYENRLIYLWEKDIIVPDNVGGNLLEYSGGPGSVLGIGKTRIKFGDLQRTGINNPLSVTDSDYFYRGGVKLHINDFTPNYTTLLEASIAAGLDDIQIGIDDSGKFDTYRRLGPHTPNYVLRPGSNYIEQPLTGSNGYQANKLLKTPTSVSDTTYSSQINQKLEDFGRELLSPVEFDGQTWTYTSLSAPKLPPYSSFDSLATDPGASSTDKEPEKIKFLNNPSSVGYLANMNKNGGISDDSKNPGKYITSHNPDRVGGRGISEDFRQVNRNKRGFFDDKNTYDYISKSSSYAQEKTLDKIYYYTDRSKRTSTNISLENNDLIPFRISIVNPLYPGDSQKTEQLNFRAYIDNFSDSYNAEWKSVSYMGRAEKQYKYNAFGRSISLGFTIVADNPTNLGIMYDQLNLLASSLAPTYTNQGYMAGNLHRLTLGNYLYEQWGIIEGLSYEVTEETPYDITPGKQLPMYIKVSGIKFTPIHNFRPEYSQGIPKQFINQNDTDKNINSPY